MLSSRIGQSNSYPITQEVKAEGSDGKDEDKFTCPITHDEFIENPMRGVWIKSNGEESPCQKHPFSLKGMANFFAEKVWNGKDKETVHCPNCDQSINAFALDTQALETFKCLKINEKTDSVEDEYWWLHTLLAQEIVSEYKKMMGKYEELKNSETKEPSSETKIKVPVMSIEKVRELHQAVLLSQRLPNSPRKVATSPAHATPSSSTSPRTEDCDDSKDESEDSGLGSSFAALGAVAAGFTILSWVFKAFSKSSDDGHTSRGRTIRVESRSPSSR